VCKITLSDDDRRSASPEMSNGTWTVEGTTVTQIEQRNIDRNHTSPGRSIMARMHFRMQL
jgi:hypothetical protein